MRDGMESARFRAIWTESQPNAGQVEADRPSGRASDHRGTATNNAYCSTINSVMYVIEDWRGIHLSTPGRGRHDKTLISNLMQVSKLTRYRKERPFSILVRLLPPDSDGRRITLTRGRAGLCGASGRQ